MPRYRITSPEGKSITVEGNRPPTEQDIAAIFGTVGTQAAPAVQPQEQNNQLSAADAIKYNLRGAAEGATFNLADIGAGLSNIVMKPLGTVSAALTGQGDVEASDFNPIRSFKEGRNQFVTEQKAFADAHPKQAFLSELAGGLLLGGVGAGKTLAAKGAKTLTKPTLWNMVKQGAKEGFKPGVKWGAGFGAGAGLTEDPDKISIGNALIGAGTGAATGGVFGPAFGAAVPVVAAGAVGLGKGVGKGVGKVVDYFKNKEVNDLVKANSKLVEQSIKEGKPLLDIADKNIMGIAEGANALSPKAEQVFSDYGQQRIAGQHPKVINEMQRYFGNKGSNQLLEELQANVQKGSKALYDRAVYQLDKEGNILLDNAGKPIGKVLPELEKLNKYELDYVGKVYGTKGLEYEVSGLPQNDMRILNYAKQLMDDDIQRLTNQGHNNQARILAEKRAAFIEKIDKANPEYKTARAFFERGKRAEDALQAGKKAISGERSNMEYDFNKLTPEEKDFYIKGVGNKLEEMSNQQAASGNIAHKVFGEETLRRLNALGIKDMDKLEAFARAESKAASNINSLRGGSPTANRQQKIIQYLMRPTRAIKRGLISTVLKSVAANPEITAKLMTDPQYLANMYARANKGNTSKSVVQALNNIGKAMSGVAAEEPYNRNLSVAEVLGNKIKEKGGYAMKEPEKLVTHLNENEILLKLPQGKRKEFLDFVDKDSNHTVAFSRFSEMAQKLKNKLNAESMNEVFEKASYEERKMLSDALQNLNNSYSEAYEKFINPKNLPPKAFYNGIKLGKQLVKGHWSKGGHVEGDDVITFYAREYKPSNLEKYFDVRNNTDTMTDYFDKDKIDFRPGDKFYKQALEAFNAQTSKRNRKGISQIIKEKLKEEGGYAANPLSEGKSVKQALNSLGEPIAKTEEGIKNFNKWFKGSKVVDEQGKPLVMYHNTTAEPFDAFDPNKIGSSGSGAYHGAGFNFASHPNYVYGKNEIPVYLNAKNILSSDKKTITREQLKKMFLEVDKGRKDTLVGDFSYQYAPYGSAEYNKSIDNAVDNLISNAESDLDIYSNFTMGSSLTHKETMDIFKKLGFDGAIEKRNGKTAVAVVFDPTQIKSIKNSGKFDPRSPNIYKSLIGGLGISQILRNRQEAK